MKISSVWQFLYHLLKWLLLFSIFLFAIPSYSQIATDFQSMGVDQGLTQNSVYTLFQDSRGFLWIGTADGLNRYDGRTIKTYKTLLNVLKPYNANFIRGNFAEDKNGNIWFTSEDGLYMYSLQQDKVLPIHIFTRQEIAYYKLSFISSENKVWMFGFAGFASYSIATHEFELIPYRISLKGSPLTTKNIEPDNQECIWFSVKEKDGLHRFNTATKTISHFFSGENLQTIHFVKGGHYRAGMQTVIYYDSVTRTSETLPIQFNDSKSQVITDLLSDKSGRLWIATRKDGLFMYNPITGKTIEFHNEQNYASLASNRLTALFIDNGGNLWIGTDGAGVCKLGIQSLTFKSSVLTKPKMFIKSIAEDADGNIIVTTLEDHIQVINPSSGKINPDVKLNRLNITEPGRIAIDSKNRVWLTQGSSIWLANSEKIVFAHGTLFNEHTEVNKLHELKSGQMVVATANGMIFTEVKGNKILPVYMLNTFHATSLVEVDEGKIWAGSRYTGLIQLQKSDTGSYQAKRILFPYQSINDIHQDEENTDVLWLASSNGLIRFNKKTEAFRVYSEADGMGNNYVYGVLEDKLHRLWFSTNGGITCFVKGTEVFVNYTNKDGLQSNEFNTGAFLKGRSGLFCFGGINGVNWFNPEEVTATREAPPIAITQLVVNEEAVNDSLIQMGTIELPYFKNDILLSFSVFDFTRSQSNKVRYQLAGFDDKVRTSDAMEVVYNNLPPGRYQLIFSGSNTSNIWSKDKFFTIIIQTPFWQQWWFYALVILSLVAFIGSIIWFFVQQRYKVRIAELEKQNAIELERRRISMEIHDDIGANLTRISLISEAAKYHVEKEKALNQIAQTSRQVVSSIGEIIWSLNPDNKTFEQLMSYLRDQLHNLLEPSGINYSIDLPETGDYLLSNTIKRNLILLIKEAVNNAVKHSGATEIKIESKLRENIFEVEIADNGCGFESNNGFGGNGIRNAKSRVHKMNGSFKIDSTLGKGTQIVFQISLNEKELYH